jgi:hypothetical protein
MSRINLQIKNRTVPFALLVLCVLGFGLLVPILGFYWDDWPAIATIRLLGSSGFVDFYKGERPFSAWTFVVLDPLIGTNPLLWHLFTLGLRWLTVLGMWWMLQLLWPERKNEVTWMAFLFAIYPTFTQQPVAVAFSQHWITFALYFFSVGCMLLAVKKPRWFIPLTVISLSTSALHMLTMEYFIGLELLRPIYLWLILDDGKKAASQRLRRTLFYWLPYLLLVAGVVIWRLFFMEIITEDPNEPVLLYSLFNQPISAIVQLAQLAAQEILTNLIGVWNSVLPAEAVDFANGLFVASLGLGALGAGLTIFYLLNLRPDSDNAPAEDRSWHTQAITLGFLAALLGSITAWITNRNVLTGLHGGRFGLAAMFGTSILVVGLLCWLTPRRVQRILIVGVLIGMAVAFHYRSTTAYFNAWVKQHQFYWQLSWRIPYLKPDSVLYSTDELFLFVGRNPTSMALNLLYPQPTGTSELSYWFVELPYHVGPQGIPDLLEGRSLNFSFRNYTFSGSSLDGLAILYEPEGGRCLWILSPRDRYNPDIPALTEEVLPISNLSRIEASKPSAEFPPQEIFGEEPYRSWCYYFQKAELARQSGDWERVVELADEAASADFTPLNPHERQPFVEAYAHTGQWGEAFRQTRRAFQKDDRYARQLCYLWLQIEEDIQLPADAGQQLSQIRENMQCPDHLIPTSVRISNR